MAKRKTFVQWGGYYILSELIQSVNVLRDVFFFFYYYYKNQQIDWRNEKKNSASVNASVKTSERWKSRCLLSFFLITRGFSISRTFSLTCETRKSSTSGNEINMIISCRRRATNILRRRLALSLYQETSSSWQRGWRSMMEDGKIFEDFPLLAWFHLWSCFIRMRCKNTIFSKDYISVIIIWITWQILFHWQKGKMSSRPSGEAVFNTKSFACIGDILAADFTSTALFDIVESKLVLMTVI